MALVRLIRPNVEMALAYFIYLLALLPAVLFGSRPKDLSPG
jgi:hypothetical protein